MLLVSVMLCRTLRSVRINFYKRFYAESIRIKSKFVAIFMGRADQCHRIPSYQSDQLIEKHLNISSVIDEKIHSRSININLNH